MSSQGHFFALQSLYRVPTKKARNLANAYIQHVSRGITYTGQKDNLSAHRYKQQLHQKVNETCCCPKLYFHPKRSPEVDRTAFLS